MAQTTVAQFANQLKLTDETLLEQLKAAGVPKKSVEEMLAEDDKARLLAYLQESHGHKEEKKKITLVRKQTTEIKKSDATGKARTIQVEVRKKRTFLKVDKVSEAVEDVPAVVEPPAPAQPIINDAEVAKRRAEEDRQAVLLAKQAEEKAKAPPKRRSKKEEAEHAKEAADAAEAEDVAAEKKAIESATKAEKADKATKAAKPEETTAKASTAKSVATAEADVDPNRPRIGERVVLKKDPPPASEGTLHRPAAKAADKDGKAADKKVVKKVAKPASTWSDDAAKRRTIKTRGDASGGREGWRSRKARSQQDNENQETNFQAPTEPIVRDVLVPETITVGELAQKMAVKAAEIIKIMMKMGSMVKIGRAHV